MMLNSFFVLIFMFSLSLSISQYCHNPNGKIGQCISILECEPLYELLKREVHRIPRPKNLPLFVQKSKCLKNQTKNSYITVCCTDEYKFILPRESNFSTEKPTVHTTTSAPTSSSTDLLPAVPHCGKIGSSDRIYGGNDTKIGEFPWMVLLEYENAKGQKFLKCGGSLLNHRYVLTAAHCVVGRILIKYGRLSRIRLGEYDLTKEIDCMDESCADPIVEIDVEEAIPYKDYNENHPAKYHDIALIRMKLNVHYTEFISPVCLPSMVIIDPVLIGTNLVVAGWGRALYPKMATIKQKLSIPLFDHNDCRNKFLTKSINLTKSQLCAGGKFLEDSCDGDSGGPLMRQNKEKFWVIEGVVSFGNQCGLQNWPGVYTSVNDYDSWIRTIIKE